MTTEKSLAERDRPHRLTAVDVRRLCYGKGIQCPMCGSPGGAFASEAYSFHCGAKVFRRGGGFLYPDGSDYGPWIWECRCTAKGAARKYERRKMLQRQIDVLERKLGSIGE